MSRLVTLSLGAVLGIAIFALFCYWPQAGTPAPPGAITDPTASGQRSAVLAYAATLEFDSVTHGVSDEQALTSFDSTAAKDTVGPVGSVYPERRSANNSESDLEGVGRIVARIVTDGPYSKLGIAAAGVTYVWVDSLTTVVNDTASGRVIYIPADSTQPVLVRPLRYTRNPGGRYDGEALARWIYHPHQSEVPWERCTKWGCCEAQ